MRGEDELRVRFDLPDQLDHVFVNGLIVQVVFRLVDDNDIVLPLTQDKENKC